MTPVLDNARAGAAGTDAPSAAGPPEAGRGESAGAARPGWSRGRVLRGLAAAAVGATVLVLGLPVISGANWSQTASVLARVSGEQVVLLGVVWLAGLWVHTIALSAAMPGLSHSRAFYLNLTGSAASNVIPLGGAAGTAVNYWSCREWGFSKTAFVRWALVTNLFDNALRLVLPATAAVWMALSSRQVEGGLLGTAVTSLVVVAAYLGVAWLLLERDWADRLLERSARRWAERLGVDTSGQPWAPRVATFREETKVLLRRATGWLVLGKTAYAASQAWLLWLCLIALGDVPPVQAAFAAFAVERALSLAVVTPGGSGVVELGTAGVLVALGVDGAHAAAAVLLYRAYTFLAEVPGGALLLVATLVRRRLQPGGRGPRAQERRTGAATARHTGTGASR